MAGIIAIVGRPNVGKSTLFNRLTRTTTALVDDRPGVTRDRIYGTLDLEGIEPFTIVDTGGFETKDVYFQPFAENIVWKQTCAAIDEADCALFVLDGKEGSHPHDAELLRFLRERNKPVVIAVNKVDGPEKKQILWDFYGLGVDDLICMSSAHNRGIKEVAKKIRQVLDAMPHIQEVRRATPDALRIALIGRPNVGKSSILNRLIGEDRSLVSNVAGTTRDPIDTQINYNGQTYTLIDTAGVRRQSRVDDKIEAVSVIMSLRALERADIVCIVIDAYEGLKDQDAKLAQMAAERCRPVIIVVNKWDLVPNKTDKTAQEYTEAVHQVLTLMSYVPVVFVSCLENLRVHKILQTIEELADTYRRRVDTSVVNESLAQIINEHTPALTHTKSKRIKFFYATQVKASPPTIVAFCNVADEVQTSYQRYMVNKFRDLLGFKHVPIRLILRGKNKKSEGVPLN